MTELEDIPAKFIKVLMKESCTLDTMSIPKRFCSTYADMIPQYVNLVQRNGDEIVMEFKKDEGLFIGMKQLFQRYNCKKGCVLAFQYNGLDNFWVHVITSAFEVFGDLPDDCGCKFVRIIAANSLKNIILPVGFVQKFANLIPSKVTFRMRNGVCVEGFFDHSRKVLSGLQQVFKLTLLKPLEIVLFTYYSKGVFDVSVFGGDCIEKTIMNDSPILGISCEYFEICVQSYHLLKYSLGVHISSKFKVLTDKWNELDRIKVYHGGRSWKLQIKKKLGKVEIHKGWTKFRVDLNLKRKDICLFEKKRSARRYELYIYRNTL